MWLIIPAAAIQHRNLDLACNDILIALICLHSIILVDLLHQVTINLRRIKEKVLRYEYSTLVTLNQA